MSQRPDPPDDVQHPPTTDISKHGAGERATRTRAEILIVLALSLGASALYSIVSFFEKLSRPQALNEQNTTLNEAVVQQPVFELIYQLLGIAVGLAPVALVCWLLWSPGKRRLARLGISGRPRLGDAGVGLLLAAGIGLPGIGLYLVAKWAGLNTNMVPNALDDYWWTVPVLILAALKAALVEEIIVVAYLFDRLRSLGWSDRRIMLASSLLRGSYHLYQGLGGFVGNCIMGLVFSSYYAKYGRTKPLIVAHWMLDIVSFVGYAWAAATFPALFGLVGS